MNMGSSLPASRLPESSRSCPESLRCIDCHEAVLHFLGAHTFLSLSQDSLVSVSIVSRAHSVAAYA